MRSVGAGAGKGVVLCRLWSRKPGSDRTSLKSYLSRLSGMDLLERMAQQGVDLQAHELLPRFVIGEIKSHLGRKAHEEVGDEEAVRVGNR